VSLGEQPAGEMAQRDGVNARVRFQVGLYRLWFSIASVSVMIIRFPSQKIVKGVKVTYIPYFYLNSLPIYQPRIFCPIIRNTYIVGKVLNPSNAYIRDMDNVVLLSHTPFYTGVT
jgi:hypothetical protein